MYKYLYQITLKYVFADKADLYLDIRNTQHDYTHSEHISNNFINKSNEYKLT